LSDFQYKKEVKANKKAEKMSLLLIFKNIKGIQGALLSNKIEYYNKGV